MPRDQPGRLELCQDAIHRRQPYILARIQQFLVHVFRTQVPEVRLLENLEYLEPRQRDLQACFA